jgi:hypothetical protein
VVGVRAADAERRRALFCSKIVGCQRGGEHKVCNQQRLACESFALGRFLQGGGILAVKTWAVT